MFEWQLISWLCFLLFDPLMPWLRNSLDNDERSFRGRAQVRHQSTLMGFNKAGSRAGKNMVETYLFLKAGKQIAELCPGDNRFILILYSKQVEVGSTWLLIKKYCEHARKGNIEKLRELFSCVQCIWTGSGLLDVKMPCVSQNVY